jgi:hypothetical protein
MSRKVKDNTAPKLCEIDNLELEHKIMEKELLGLLIKNSYRNYDPGTYQKKNKSKKNKFNNAKNKGA